MAETLPVEVVCSAFGLGDHRGARARWVAQGAMGGVWHLRVGEAEYAVKTLFWETPPDAGEAGDLLRRAARDAGVRAPEARRTADGRLVGHGLSVATWQHGEHLAAERAGTAEATAVGRLLGTLHRLALPATGPADPWYEKVPDAAEWDEILDADEPWMPDLRRNLPRIRALGALVTPTRPEDRILCHLDVSPGNVLWDGGGPVLLDWDDAGAGSPARELASVLTRWGFTGPARAAAVRAYRDAGGPAAAEVPGMYEAATVNFVFVQARLAADPGAPEWQRRDARARLADAICG